MSNIVWTLFPWELYKNEMSITKGSLRKNLKKKMGISLGLEKNAENYEHLRIA